MRYAVYFIPPPDNPLTRQASAWIGRNVFTNESVKHPEVPGINPERIPDLTAFPHRYGFHATLKAPFHLATGCVEEELVQAFTEFCRESRPVTISRLVVARLGSFVALVPENPVPDLNAIADAAVRAFEPMRAPLSDSDIARRNPQNLSALQKTNLEEWGYPYVFGEFQFHMTLTGPLNDTNEDRVAAVLRSFFAPILRQPVIVRSLALCVQERPDGNFIVHTCLPLGSENSGNDLTLDGNNFQQREDRAIRRNRRR